MVPKLETQKLINDHLKTAEKLCDEALTNICLAAAMAITERAFGYARVIIDTAEAAEKVKCNCFMRVVTIDGKKEPPI